MSQPGTDGTGHCILSVYTRTHARATTVEIRAPVLSVPNASDAVNGGEMAQQKPSTVEHGGSSNELKGGLHRWEAVIRRSHAEQKGSAGSGP